MYPGALALWKVYALIVAAVVGFAHIDESSLPPGRGNGCGISMSCGQSHPLGRTDIWHHEQEAWQGAEGNNNAARGLVVLTDRTDDTFSLLELPDPDPTPEEAQGTTSPTTRTPGAPHNIRSPQVQRP